MANIVKGLEKGVAATTKGVAAAKKAVDRVLWGNVNAAPAVPAPGTPSSGPKKSKVGSFIQSGLFNVLDALLQVDLCNIITYLISEADNQMGKSTKRKENPTKVEKALYTIQDQATLIREAIDSFYGAPNQILKDLQSPPDTPTPAPGTTPTTNPPVDSRLSGSAMKKYNLGILGKYMANVFKVVNKTQQLTTGAVSGTNEIIAEGLADPEVKAALSIIPGFNANITALQDYIQYLNRYTDLRNIPNEEFQKLLDKLDTVRSVCVVIEGFSLAGALDLAQQFIGVDIRSQIAKLNEYLNPKKIIPTLKEIDNSLKSFIKTCKQIQGYIRIGRGFIKIAIVLVRIYRYIAKLISSIPAPLRFLTFNVTAKLENAKEAAKENSSALIKFLEQLNALMGVLLTVVKYLQQNTEALLQRVEKLLSILESCAALDNSELVDQLKASQANLVTLNQELNAIIADFERKPTNEYGQYKIVIIEETLTDTAITNKRRRGVALDINGVQVIQSDLTFATNDAVIIEEVKLLLIAAGLISPELSETDLVIIEASKYLGEDSSLLGDMKLDATMEGANILAGLDNTPEADRAKRAFRKRMKTANDQAKKAINNEMARSSAFLGIVR